jgi:glycosyltransferase involved in cell wall biosynthesis
VAELAARLGDLAADPSLVRKMGERGRERVAAAFQWDDKLRLVRDTLSAVVHRG